MGTPNAPFQLAVEQVMPPLPSSREGAVSWLRAFAGASWIAYGARSAVVIQSAPSPSQPAEAASYQFFQQVLDVAADADELPEKCQFNVSSRKLWKNGDQGIEENVGLDSNQAEEQGAFLERKNAAELATEVRTEVKEKEDVVCVAWETSGKFLGALIAASGSRVHLIEPQSLTATGNVPGLPLVWRSVQILSHQCPVVALSWTASGDGILCSGDHQVVMWQRVESPRTPGEAFCQLWQFSPALKQSLAAASWCAEGLAATADAAGEEILSLGESFFAGRVHSGRAKKTATIWMWCWTGEEDKPGLSLERGEGGVVAIELPHPEQVLRLQWRPGGEAEGGKTRPLSTAYRQVLLTSCADGVVRLWLESDGGRSRTEESWGGIGRGRRAPIFFVGAVIEANSLLGGRLGTDISVAWSEEVKTGSCESSETHGGALGGDVAPCEWLLGVGPKGTVTLWALHCLDDVHPPRCPRVLLWQQAVGLLPAHTEKCEPLPENSGILDANKHSVGPQKQSLVVHCAVQRSVGSKGGPPTAVELFENFRNGQFRYSRMWPPVSAIGGGGRGGNSNGGGGYSTTGQTGSYFKRSTWGLSSEVFHRDGHEANVVSTAVHAAPGAGLVASIDQCGAILLWRAETLSCPRLLVPLESPGNGGLWKVCGRIAGTEKNRSNSAETSRLENANPSVTSLVSFPADSGNFEKKENLHLASKERPTLQLLAWASLLLPGGSKVLLRAHQEGVEVLLVSECGGDIENNEPSSGVQEGVNKGAEATKASLDLGTKPLCMLELPKDGCFRGGVEGVYVLHAVIQSEGNPESNGGSALVYIAGITGEASTLVAWKLTLDYTAIKENHGGSMLFAEQWLAGSVGGSDCQGNRVEPPRTDESRIGTAEREQCLQTKSEYLGKVISDEWGENFTSAMSVKGDRCEWEAGREVDEGEWGQSAATKVRDGLQYCLVTGSVNGRVKFWRLTDKKKMENEGVHSASSVKEGWTSVGCLQAHESAVVFIGVAAGGGRLATASVSGSLTHVKIWEAETCSGEKTGGNEQCYGFALEGKLTIMHEVTALDWLNQEKGLLVLVVSTSKAVHVFTREKIRIEDGNFETNQDGESLESQKQDKELYQAWHIAGGSVERAKTAEERESGEGQPSESGGWREIATLYSSTQSIQSVRWGPHGSLIVSAGSQIWVLSQWLLSKRLTEVNGSALGLTMAKSASSPMLARMKVGASNKGMIVVKSDESLLRPNSQCGDGTVRRAEESGSYSLLEYVRRVAAPLPDYHPRALLLYLHTGQKRRVRACIRHLALSLREITAVSSPRHHHHQFDHEPPMPAMCLSDLLDDGPSPNSSRTVQGGAFGRRPALGEGSFLSSTGHERKQNPFSLTAPISGQFPGESTEVGEGDGVEEGPISRVRRGGEKLFSKGEVEEIAEVLGQSPSLPGLSRNEGIELLAIFDAMAEVDAAEQGGQRGLSLDPPAEWFRLALRTAVLAVSRKEAKKAEVEEVIMGSKDIAWLLHSETKEALLSACLPENATWQAYRALGIGYWLTNGLELRQRMEKLARQQFLQRRDGKDCALLYMALDRRTVLLGLLKLSRDEKDKKLVEFLGRDFKDEKHQAAALKNAYVLMSQHRFELAAAFFVLGGDAVSAGTVCARNLNDPQLGLVVSRLLDSSNPTACGPIATDLIQRVLLPAALRRNDRWQACTLQWLLGNRIEALREVVVCGYSQAQTSTLQEKPICFDPEAGDFCALVAAKPGLASGPHAAEAAEIAAKSTLQSVYAFDRAGLQLLALERLSSPMLKPAAGPLKPTQKQGNSAFAAFSFMSDSEDSDSENAEDSGSAAVNVEDDMTAKAAKGLEMRIGEGWVADAVIEEVRAAMKDRLATQTLVNRHPFWKEEAAALSKAAGSNDRQDDGADGDGEVEVKEVKEKLGNDSRKLEEDVRLAVRAWKVETTTMAGSLAAFAVQTQRLYLLCRLLGSSTLQAPWNTESPFCLPNSSNVSEAAARLLQNMLRRAPPALARTVLACGGTAAPTAALLLQSNRTAQTADSKHSLPQAAGGHGPLSRAREQKAVMEEQGKGKGNGGGEERGRGILPEAQAMELVRFAGELMELLAISDGLAGGKEVVAAEGEEGQEKGRRRRIAGELLALFCAVAAAWLSREPSVLLGLVRRTMEDRNMGPFLPLSGDEYLTWYKSLRRGEGVGEGEEERRNREKGAMPSVPHVSGPSALAAEGGGGTLTLSEDDTWRILSVALWGHMGAYVRKKLARGGKAGEVRYEAFGWASPQQQAQLKVGGSGYSSQLPTNAPSTSTTPLHSPPLSSTLTPAGSPYASPPYQNSPSQAKSAIGMGGGVSVISRPANVVSTPVKAGKKDEGDIVNTAFVAAASGLRCQLAAHLQLAVQVNPEADSISRWIWGEEADPLPLSRADMSKDAARGGRQEVSKGKENGSSVQERVRSTPEVVLAVTDSATLELWGLIVVREKIRTALSLEGLSSPPRRRKGTRAVGGGTWNTSRGDEDAGGGGGKHGSSGEGAGGGAGGSTKGTGRGERSGDVGRKKPVNGRGGQSGGSGRKLEQPSISGRERAGEGEHGVKEKNLTWQSLPVFGDGEEVCRLPGELLEAVCVNALDPRQVVIATNRKGLVFADMATHEPFSSSPDNLWGDSHWPRNGWAGSVATPPPATYPPGLPPKRTQSMIRSPSGRSMADMSMGGLGMGIPGYGGIGAWGLGWEDWEDAVEGFADPPATLENVASRALAAHPLRPLFLAGSNNTHVYLWEFGKTTATATYGVLPPPNTAIPLSLASVAAVRFDRYGHRFATAAADGTLSTWRIEVGGRSNVRPADTRHCFSRQSYDCAYVGAGGSVLAAGGLSPSNSNLVLWDTLAPPTSSRASAICHEGGALSIDVIEAGSSGGGSYPLIVSGGKGGDIAVHDFRFIANGKGRSAAAGEGALWLVPKAHSGSASSVAVIPGTTFFLSGSKDGDMKLWDAATCQQLQHWPRVHERRTFLNARGFAAVMQAAVMDIVPTPGGILTCGADGLVKLFSYRGGSEE